MQSKEKIPELFGSNVFNEAAMQQYVSGSAFQAWKSCLSTGTPLPLDVANDIADGMKVWALEHGATHFTHWFQPLTGVTAEKHDSFIHPVGGGKIIMDFSGKELVRGEPDASSFPSGGLRATFEARGYSGWDPTAFAFIKDGSLCIPTVFCSYSGEALDKKTPLLRSIDAVSRQAVRILRLFGDDKTQKVYAQVGPEQEYFLIDKQLYLQREDLRLCGRTLFGAKPPKGQELDDHYFGSIRPRVTAYMQDLDEELWKLGVLSKTKHNEVAPSQHEMAPIYTDANAANDQNQLTMEIMKKVAEKHGLICLLHEKPFAGVNGSGKHNNWSLGTKHENLLDPGDTPMENLQFMVFLSAVIEAVDDYADLLRTSVATPGNDHRLGANEAPPAIISIFVGEELEAVIDAIASDSPYAGPVKMKMDLGVDVLPKFSKDTTDRNRTSPFAFTGNKFEFRACGSEQNVSDSNLVLDAAVAKSLKSFADALEGTPEDEFQDAALEYCKKVLTDHQRILFSGDGYSDEWPVEAKKRGLANNKTTADALPAFVSDKAIALFEETGVLTKAEAQCRYDCKLEKYNKLMNIEATTMVREARRTYRPVITAYATKVAKGLETIRAAGAEAAMQCEQNTLNKLCNGITAINDSIKALDAVHQKAEALDGQEQANVYAHEVVPAMDTLRAAVDAMEEIVAADYWPVPTYDDILFYV